MKEKNNSPKKKELRGLSPCERQGASADSPHKASSLARNPENVMAVQGDKGADAWQGLGDKVPSSEREISEGANPSPAIDTWNFRQELKGWIITEHDIQNSKEIEFSYSGELIPMEIVEREFDKFIRRLKERGKLKNQDKLDPMYILDDNDFKELAGEKLV